MSERLSDLRLNERELIALENSSGDDCDMASVRCVIAELRAARVVVEAAMAWQRVYRSTGPREYMTRALNERARLSAVIDALAGAK